MSAPAESHRSEPPDERIGTVVAGRYRIVAAIGRGGMGAVYRAEHLELGTEAAIKLLAPELARNRVAIERFEREARNASRVRHPGVVHVYDLGRTSDGSPYLAMERLEGRDLSEELDSAGGVLPPERVVSILALVASALDACHAAGVVHRDLKPSNIFLARLGDGREEPKLVDFGLALLLASDERLTKTGAVAGTPHYVPPESARGQPAGPAGDVYALATVAFRALCGTTPFDAELASGVLVQKVIDDAPTMSERTGRRFPAAVEAALARGLAREPEDRPESASALVQGLRDAVAACGPDDWPAPPLADPHAATPRLAPETRPASPTARDRSRDPVPNRDSSTANHSAPPAPSREGRIAKLRGPLIGLSILALSIGLGSWALLESRGPESDATPQTPEQPSSPTPDTIAGAEPPRSESEPTAEAPSATPEATSTEAETEVPPEAATGRGRAPSSRRATVAQPPEAPAPVTPDPEGSAAGTPAGRPAASSQDTAEAERLVRSAGSLLLRGELEGATRLLQRAVRSAPDYAPAWRSLGLAHERSHRPADARAAYRRYLSLAPGASDAARIEQRIATLGD